MNAQYYSIDVPDGYTTTTTAARHLGVPEETIDEIIRILAWGVDGCAFEHVCKLGYAHRLSTANISDLTVWHTSTLLEVATFALHGFYVAQAMTHPARFSSIPDLAETFCTYTREDDLAAGFGIPPEMFYDEFASLIEGRGWYEEELIELGDVYVDADGKRWYYRPFVISEMVACRF